MAQESLAGARNCSSSSSRHLHRTNSQQLQVTRAHIWGKLPSSWRLLQVMGEEESQSDQEQDSAGSKSEAPASQSQSEDAEDEDEESEGEEAGAKAGTPADSAKDPKGLAGTAGPPPICRDLVLAVCGLVGTVPQSSELNGGKETVCSRMLLPG